jgi:hypothetical protein
VEIPARVVRFGDAEVRYQDEKRSALGSRLKPAHQGGGGSRLEIKKEPRWSPGQSSRANRLQNRSIAPTDPFSRVTIPDSGLAVHCIGVIRRRERTDRIRSTNGAALAGSRPAHIRRARVVPSEGIPILKLDCMFTHPFVC